MSFFDRLEARIDSRDSILTVGLDPDFDRLPKTVLGHDRPRWVFNRNIIDAIADHAVAVKPNAAFYEDTTGWSVLEDTISYAHHRGLLVILDGKRGDIGNTAQAYARASKRVDAVTVNPYLGSDSVKPFLEAPDRGVFVLCRTSNPSADEVQSLTVDGDVTVAERVASLAGQWNDRENVGLVVGATSPSVLENLRQQVPDLPFLVPGVGAQGGSIERAVTAGCSVDGLGLVNSSRGIIFAGEDTEDDYARAAGMAAKSLNQQLNQFR